MEISFHIPNSNTQFVGDENRPPAQVSLFLTYYLCCGINLNLICHDIEYLFNLLLVGIS